MRTKFLGIPLDVLSLERVREDVVRAVQTRKSIVHCSLNALKVVEARRDPGTRQLIEHFDLITPDGMSVVWGRRLLGERRTEQVAGVISHARDVSEEYGGDGRHFYGRAGS